MRLIFGLVLLVGVGLAGLATYMAKTHIDRYQQQLVVEREQRPPPIETVDVMVAARDLKYGEKLEKDAVLSVAYPRTSLPKGVFTEQATLFPENSDGPREVLRSLAKGEVILTNKVTEPGQPAGISARLADGMRAFAIEVDAKSGVSGFLRPGDRVDVYWTGSVGRDNMRTEGDSTGSVTKLIESRMSLVAVDQSADMDREARIARTVTVAATPQQVAALAQAQSTGRLSLSLVGALDESLSEVIEVDQHRLLGIQAVEVPEPPQMQEERCTIRTRRGSEVVETPIPCTN